MDILRFLEEMASCAHYTTNKPDYSIKTDIDFGEKFGNQNSANWQTFCIS